MAASPPRVTESPAAGRTLEESARHTRRITALSVTAALVLIGAKAAAWFATGSVAVLASLADSGLDLLASLVTFFAVRYAAEPPDAEHRFGHGKAEAYASVIQGALVLTSAGLIGREALERMVDPRPLQSEAWAVGVMVFSLGVSALLVAAQTRALRRTGSVAVAGDRAHYLADLGSTGVALAGVALASWLDRPVLDAAAGLLVTAALLWTAYRLFLQTSRHLMDHELSPADQLEIRRLLAADPAVHGVHQFRTRASGPHLHVQAHMDLDAGLSLLEAHAIVEAAERRVAAAYPSVDIILHPDPFGHAERHLRDFDESRAPAGASPRP